MFYVAQADNFSPREMSLITTSNLTSLAVEGNCTRWNLGPRYRTYFVRVVGIPALPDITHDGQRPLATDDG